MSLQVISNNHSSASLLNRILTNYFPLSNMPKNHSSKQNSLYVDTKYFTCLIQIKNPQNINNHHLQTIQKVDMVIFLFDQHEQVENIQVKVNQWIQKISPEVVVVVVNSKNNEEDNSWKYQEQIAQCETIVPVVYENLDKISKILPKWNHSGLLQQHEEQFQIYQVLEMIQTCPWQKMQKKSTQNKQQKIVRQPNNAEMKKQQKQFKKEVEQKNTEDIHQEEQQLNEEQMERQMRQFQLLMQQMMQIKSMPENGCERKKKAQDIIMKLAKNINQQ